MKKTLISILVMASLVAPALAGQTFRGRVVFTDEVTFDGGAKWMIDGTQVTSSAAELNQVDTGAVQADTIVEKTTSAGVGVSDLRVNTLLTLTPGSVTATNGQELAVATSYVKVTPSALATCTVANASRPGQIVAFENVGTNNLVLNDDGTTLALGGNITNAATDILILIANDTNAWRKVSNSNN